MATPNHADITAMAAGTEIDSVYKETGGQPCG